MKLFGFFPYGLICVGVVLLIAGWLVMVLVKVEQHPTSVPLDKLTPEGKEQWVNVEGGGVYLPEVIDNAMQDKATGKRSPAQEYFMLVLTKAQAKDALADQAAHKQMTYPRPAVYVRFTPAQYRSNFPSPNDFQAIETWKLDDVTTAKGVVVPGAFRPMNIEGKRVEGRSVSHAFVEQVRNANHIPINQIVLIQFEGRPDESPSKGMLIAGFIALGLGILWSGYRLIAHPKAAWPKR